MNLLYYLAEANIYLGVFYLAYCLLLNKETYYQLNRAYLLFSCAAAFVLPVLQVGALKPVEVAVNTTLNYTLPAYTEQIPATGYVNAAPVVIEHHLTMQDYLVYAYLLGAVILFAMLMIKLFGLARLMRNAQTSDALKYKVVYLPETSVAFSFFNYLFIGNNASGANTIIRHELVHIRQKHSVDVIFLEVLKVINWFNPFVYLLQNSLKTVHEYIADEQTAALEADALTYSAFLVNNAYGTDGPAFTHSFFNYNLLKKRIIMLNRERSGRAAGLKYLVILPLFAGLLCVSTLAFSKTYGWVDLDPAKPVKQQSANIQYQLQGTRKIKFAPPSVLSNDLDNLNKYLQKTVRFDKTVSKLSGGLVVVSFAITADHTIADAQIARSGGAGFDAIALRAFKNYNGSVNGKAGSYRFIFDFYDDYNTDEESAIANSDLATRAGYLVILRPLPKPKLIIMNGKIIHPLSYETVSADSMTEIPENTAWAIKKWGDKAKNGVRIFSGHGQVIKKSDAHIQSTNTVTKPDLQKLGRYIADNIKYPVEDRKQNIVGKVITDFAVDANHNLQYAKAIRSPSDAMSDEIIRVLKACPEFDALKPGTQYRLPITFSLGYTDGNGEPIPGSQNTTRTHDLNSGIYNPNNLNFSLDKTSLELNEVFIRGYIKRSAIPIQVVDTVAKPDWGKFYQYISAHVLYPSADRKEHVYGRVITIFAVDADHNLQYAKVVRTPSDAMANEVIRVLKKCTELYILKPGVQYTLPISYTLDNGNSGDVPPLTQTLPKVHDPNSGIYNPNSIDIQNLGGGLALNEVVIRGYTKQN